MEYLESKEVEKIGQRHPFGFAIIILDKNAVRASRQMKSFSGCEKKIFVDESGTRKMLILYQRENVIRKIAQYKDKISELEAILKEYPEDIKGVV